MPELPEVETVRRGLARVVGLTLTRLEQRRPDLRIPLPADFAKRLEGRRLEGVDRRGKYMLWRFSGGPVLIVHLGMSGTLILRDGPRAPELHEHVVFTFTDGTTLAYQDPRRFGLMTLTTADDASQHRLLTDMGPEPLGNEFNGPVLAAALKGRKSPLKTALLDQRLVAGLGNIYVCEALYRAGLSPERLAGTLRGPAVERLAQAIKAVLTDAIAAGGSSLRNYVQASGELGYFQHRWAVYGKEGERCPGCSPAARCRVQRVVQGARSTFYCPRTQV